jgi:hypothetical protein
MISDLTESSAGLLEICAEASRHDLLATCLAAAAAAVHKMCPHILCLR